MTTTETSSTKKPASSTSTLRVDVDGDGVVDDVYASYAEYDNKGRSILTRWTYDLGNDGDIEEGAETTYAYTSKGGILSEHTASLGSGATYTTDTTWTYDRHGLMTGSVSVDADGSVLTYALAYVQKDHVALATETFDEGGDGDIDTTRSTTSVWAGDLLLSQVEEYRFGLGGVNPGIEVFTTTWEYDDEGRTVLRTFDSDQDADGIDTREKIAWVYDGAGRLLTETTTIEGGDGVLDMLRRMINVYDEQGTLLSSTSEVDEDGDGVIDYRSTQTTTTS